MRYRFSLCFILLLCTGALMLSAQNNTSGYNYSYLTINEGLCDNNIRAIHKDQLGFVWIGTSNGLDRYDGYELKHYSVGADQLNRFIESNYIYDITEDSALYLWVASDAGLTRIDLQREEISSLREYKGANNEILTTPVQSIYVDERQNLWIGKNDGLAYIVLNEDKEIEEIRMLKKNVDIRTIIRHDNEIWAGGKDLLLRYSNTNIDRIIEIPLMEKMNFSKLTVNALFSFGNYLWIGTHNGLYCANTQSENITLYQNNPNNKNSISSNYVTDIEKNESGDIVIVTRNGLNIFQRNEQFIQYKKGEKGLSLNDNIISKVFVDEHNRIWVGSVFSGISLMNPAQIQFTHSLQGNPDEKPLIVSAVLEDNKGNLLVGIVDGGLAIKLKGAKSFSFYTHNEKDASSLGHNNISDIVQDFEGNYWISTIGGGIDKLSKNNLSHPRFEHFTTENSELLSDDIQDLCLDPIRNSIWICNRRYIQILDFSTNRISRLQYFTRSREIPEHMNAIFVDSQSRLWIGGNGIHIIDLKDYRNGYECISYTHKLDDPESMVKEKITCILETKDREIYLGSMGNGIYQLDKAHSNGTHTFINYAGRSGLSDVSISNMIEDEYGNIWISTLKGIYLFNAFTKRTTMFDEEDGLQVQQFYKRAGCKTANNQMILGTTNGLVSFNSMVHIPKSKDRVVMLTGFYSDGEELIPFRHKKNLTTSITRAEEIHLYPKQHSFELSYSSLEYTGQEKIYYFHRIMELDESINVNRTRRNARYTHMHPGKYTFEVWCTNSDNTWSSNRTYLSIIVHPPFYQTTWFYTLIAILIISAIFYSLNGYYQRQKRIQQMLKEKIDNRTAALSKTIEELEFIQREIIDKNEQLQIQNEEINHQKNAIFEMSQQMEHLNKEKISYFTNIAHEFKTPLALILGPTKQLIQNAENLEKKESLGMINRNAHYLLSLVNQLMDLHKIDTNKLTLNPVQFNLVDLLNQTIADFTGLMQQRGIQIEMRYRLKYPSVVTDRDHIHKVLYNLLSNAVKYTPDKGNVTIHAAQLFNRSEEPMLYIAVTNSGSTINNHDAEKIFDRFYRIPGQQKYAQFGQSSTGIGLHIVKEIVSLLNGQISVKSSDKNGVTFRIYFPIICATQTDESVFHESEQLFTIADVIPPFIPVDQDKPNLLLVEDNPDMRVYIKNVLLSRFNVAEANNGETGFEAAKKIVPDIIVSDLMMPVCDGAAFCRRIRENLELCHIPFLLLTANSSEKAYIESFENGIDGYITKPFEESILLAQIESIMKNRDLRQQKFIDGGLNLSELEAGYSDQQFMKEVIGIIEKNYEDSNFGVKELVAQLNMSYTIVYKKLVSLSGVPPVKFLLLYRLRIAKLILERNKRNNVIVSEIAYRVGFNDPKYFTRCFVKQYNMTPSAIIHQESSQ